MAHPCFPGRCLRAFSCPLCSISYAQGMQVLDATCGRELAPHIMHAGTAAALYSVENLKLASILVELPRGRAWQPCVGNSQPI